MFLNRKAFGKPEKIPTRESAFRHLFPHKKFDDLRIRHLMEELLIQLENFITINLVQANEFYFHFTMLQHARRKELNKHVGSGMVFLENSLEKKSFRNAEYFYNRFLLEAEKSKQASSQEERISGTDLESVNNPLDNFYIITKLKYVCEMMNERQILSGENKLLLMDEILSHLEKNPDSYENVPVMHIYYLIFLTLKNSGDTSNYFKLKKMLFQQSGFAEQEEEREIFTYIQNYCIRKINAGDENFLNELFEIYKHVLDKKIIFKEGFLSPWDYKNIVVISLRLSEFSWTENFIEHYKNFILSAYRENAWIYNMAKLRFHQKDFHSTLQFLQKVNYEDVFYSLDSKTTLLKTYYELKDIVGVSSVCESFSAYLRRNRLVSQQHKTNYKNFIHLTRLLSDCRSNGKPALEIVRNRIQETTQVADSNWLKEKVGEMGGGG